MDLLKKVETLLNATARSKLPRRGRRTILDEQEAQVLAEIRQALAEMKAQERVLYNRLQNEQAQAEEAAQRGDRPNQLAHQSRASELERHLEEEGVRAIDLEEKLAALEEKLALAQEAVEKQARTAAHRVREADEILDRSDGQAARQTEYPSDASTGDEADLAARKSRLSD